MLHFESGQLFATDREVLKARLSMGKQIDGGYDPGVQVVNQLRKAPTGMGAKTREARDFINHPPSVP